MKAEMLQARDTASDIQGLLAKVLALADA